MHRELKTLKYRELRRVDHEPPEYHVRKMSIRQAGTRRIEWHLFNCVTGETTEHDSEFDALMTAGYS